MRAMRRLLWVLIVPFLYAACATDDPNYGAGRITLSPRVKASFEEYEGRNAPLYFVVTESGTASSYVYCEGGFGCTRSATRMELLDRCRKANPGEDCKIYAVGRSVVWRDADAPRARRQLSPGEQLVQACLDGATPEVRINACSQVIASPELARGQKRGAYYVRARAYEQLGQSPEAARDYEAVLSIDPAHVAAKSRLQALTAPRTPPSQVPQGRA